MESPVRAAQEESIYGSPIHFPNLEGRGSFEDQLEEKEGEETQNVREQHDESKSTSQDQDRTDQMESADNVLKDTVAQNQSKNSEGNIPDLTANNKSQKVSEICASDVCFGIPCQGSSARKPGQNPSTNSTNCSCKN